MDFNRLSLSGFDGFSSLPHGAPAAEARLVPILARAIELGRGPPGLVQWVRGRLAAGGAESNTGPGAVPHKPLLRRLAGELARVLRPGGVDETLTDRFRQTLRSRLPERASDPR